MCKTCVLCQKTTDVETSIKESQVFHGNGLTRVKDLPEKETGASRFQICSSLSAEGFKEAAEKFRMESGIEPSVDLETLDERIKIREMILKGQIQEAIALVNSLHPELLDTNRYLYFHLQVRRAGFAIDCFGNALWVGGPGQVAYLVVLKNSGSALRAYTL